MAIIGQKQSDDDPPEPSPSQQPQPPEHLRPATKRWWSMIVSHWEIEEAALQTLQAAAESWDRYQGAREALAEHGLVYTDPKGMVRARPEASIERDSRIAYVRCMRELNLKVEPPEEPRYGQTGWPLKRRR